MQFNIGEHVGFLYEKGGGIVRRFGSNSRIFVEDETGFERPFLPTELVKIYSNDYQIPDGEQIVMEDETLSSAQLTVKSEKLEGNRRSTETWEIDLHIENLLDSHQGMSNAEIMLRQMTEFRSFFKRAMERGVPKIVVIHGVGEGVLKNEIRMFLAKKDQVEFYDANFLEYGKGATEIRIHHSDR